MVGFQERLSTDELLKGTFSNTSSSPKGSPKQTPRSNLKAADSPRSPREDRKFVTIEDTNNCVHPERRDKRKSKYIFFIIFLHRCYSKYLSKCF